MKKGNMEMGNALNYLRLQLGKLVFRLLEPILRCWENQDTDVRVHLHRGLVNLDKKKTAIALLNLNMVLSIKQNHFLALVSRGRLHLQEGRYQLAAQDFQKANQVSVYRFTHYDLSREYRRSFNFNRGSNSFHVSIFNDFKEFLELMSEINFVSGELEPSGTNLLSRKNSTEGQECEEKTRCEPASTKLYFSELDRVKFAQLGPITQQEIKNIDWDQLVQDFFS